VDTDGGNPAIFDVNFYSARDTIGYASIVGDATALVGIGMNAANTLQVQDPSAISVESSNTLYIANASLNSNAALLSADILSSAITVTGGTVVVGQDRTALATGTVYIGNDAGQYKTDGVVGVLLTDGTMQDAPLVGQSSVVIQGQVGADIAAHGATVNITLASNPIFGSHPKKAGFGICGIKHDQTGLAVQDSAGVISISNATFQCITSCVLIAATANVSVTNSTMTNCDTAVYAQTEGSIALQGTTIMYSQIGIWQDVGTTIDLSSGGNTVICSSQKEAPANGPGMDMFNSSTTVLNASNVAWDTAGPDYFTCNQSSAYPPLFSSCSCNLSSCTTTPGNDDMDAVTLDAGITTTGNTQSPLAVDAGCG
jgi:hypothetical protein